MTIPDDTEPSAEAHAVAEALRREPLHRNGHYYQVALALDRFRAAGVREERRALSALLHWFENDPTSIGAVAAANHARNVLKGENSMTEFDYQREREWGQTDIGKAFVRYTNCLVGETIAGENEGTSDKRLKELNEKTNQFRKEFLLLVRGW